MVTKASVDSVLDKIDDFVGAEMNHFGTPGVAVSVVHDDVVLFSKGYGPNRRPISLYSRDSAKPREISSRSVNINILRTMHPVPPTRQDQMLGPAEPKVS
jgi:hypothetical protein